MANSAHTTAKSRGGQVAAFEAYEKSTVVEVSTWD